MKKQTISIVLIISLIIILVFTACEYYNSPHDNTKVVQNENMELIENVNSVSSPTNKAVTEITLLPKAIPIDDAAKIQFLMEKNSDIESDIDQIRSTIAKKGNESNVYTVAKTGTADFTTLKDAVYEAVKHENSTVRVLNGTYDLIEEWGPSFLDNYKYGRVLGLPLYNGIHLFFSANTLVTFNYSGDNKDVCTHFSPFSGHGENGEVGDYTIEGLNIEAKNTRYIIHDDPSGNNTPYTHKYINCHMFFPVSEKGYVQVIGGGLGRNGTIIIEGGYYYGSGSTHTGVISWHNTSLADSRGKIVIKDVYLDGPNESANFRFGYYGSSTQVTPIFISGCSMQAAPVLRPENNSAKIVNMKLFELNNTIRTSQ